MKRVIRKIDKQPSRMVRGAPPAGERARILVLSIVHQIPRRKAAGVVPHSALNTLVMCS